MSYEAARQFWQEQLLEAGHTVYALRKYGYDRLPDKRNELRLEAASAYAEGLSVIVGALIRCDTLLDVLELVDIRSETLDAIFAKTEEPARHDAQKRLRNTLTLIIQHVLA